MEHFSAIGRMNVATYNNMGGAAPRRGPHAQCNKSEKDKVCIISLTCGA